MSPTTRLKAAFVGAGYVSGYHAKALQSLDFVDIVAVCDHDRDRREAFARTYGGAAVGDFGELAALRPDVVHILTPPSSHCELALRALRVGSHVLVEKPMAQTAEECDRMIAAADEAGRVLSVNHSARLDPIILRAVDLVRRGVCGDVLAVDFIRSSDYPPYHGGARPPYCSSGAYPLQDIGVHGLSMFEAFLGEVTDLRVQYSSTGRNPLLTFDEWQALVRCERGNGRMYLSWNVGVGQNELIVHGTRGVMHVDCYLQTCTVRRKRLGPKLIEKPLNEIVASVSTLAAVGVNSLRLASGRLRPSPGIHDSVRQFYVALRHGGPPPIPPQEGRRLTAWIEEVSREPNEEHQRLRVALRKSPAPANVLVTGATGFLGRALVSRLVQTGHTCRVLLRRPSATLDTMPNVSVVVGDLGDPEDVSRAVNGVDVVYHAGAAMGGHAADFECATVWGTRNVVNASLQHHVKRLVHVSSLSTLQHVGRSRGARVDESWPAESRPDQRGLYTRSKLVAEQLVNDAIRMHGLPAVIIRPGMIVGSRSEPAIPSGAFSIGGRWIVAGRGTHRLPLVYIDDVVDALMRAAEEEGAVARTFHIVDESSITQKEYVRLAQRSYLGAPRVVYLPPLALVAIAVALRPVYRLLRRTPITPYQIRSLAPLSAFNTDAAKTFLRWSPSVGVAEGLRRCFPERAGEPHVAVSADVSAT